MTIIHQCQTGGYCFVQVPGKHYVRYLMEGNRCLLCFKNTSDFDSKMLPPGNWSIVGKASETNEAQAAEMAEIFTPIPIHYKSYHSDVVGYVVATESFASLLTFHNLLPETTVILKEL